MWPFKGTKWVVVKQEIQPSKLEILDKCGQWPASIKPWLLERSALIHYRDEISGNERVEKITL